jgi:hypothetical protein
MLFVVSFDVDEENIMFCPESAPASMTGSYTPYIQAPCTIPLYAPFLVHTNKSNIVQHGDITGSCIGPARYLGRTELFEIQQWDGREIPRR